MRIFFLSFLLAFSAFPLFGAVKGAYHHYFALEGDFVYWKIKKSPDTSFVKTSTSDIVPINDNSQVVSLICNETPGKTLLSSKDLVKSLDYQPGVRLSAKIFYGIHSTWVFSYTGFLNWKGTKIVECASHLNLPGKLASLLTDFQDADRVKALSLSNLYTADVTYWRHVTPRYTDHFSVSWMVGLRFFQINEKLKLDFSKKTSQSTYRTKTENQAFGPFFGGDFEFNPYSFMTWGLSGNGGPLVNLAKGWTRIQDENNTVMIRNDFQRESNFAYFLHLYPFIEFRFVKFFTLRAGYDVLYIGRIALAENQVDKHLHEKEIKHEGNSVYHGLFAGIQLNF